MRRKSDHVDRAAGGVWQIFPEGKAVSPGERLPPACGVFHVEAGKAADIVANGVSVRPGWLNGHAMSVAEDAVRADRLGGIAGGRHIEQRAMQKGRAANVAHAFPQHSLVRHDLRFVFGQAVMDLGHHIARRVGNDLVAAVGKANGTIFMVAVEVNGRADLMQEGQPSKQIVHQRLRPVWLVRVAASAGAETGEVNGITEVNARLGLVSVQESQERFAGLRVNVGTVTTRNADPFLPFTGD